LHGQAQPDEFALNFEQPIFPRAKDSHLGPVTRAESGGAKLLNPARHEAGFVTGALLGGELADRYPERTLALFAIIELSIAAFGICSPALIRAAGVLAVSSSLGTIAAVNFLLLLFPTMLMGATLPILVTHVVRHHRNIGVSIGLLYFANTLGAALGAALTGMLILYYFGLTATIYLAAALNACVSAAVWFGLRRHHV